MNHSLGTSRPNYKKYPCQTTNPFIYFPSMMKYYNYFMDFYNIEY